MLRADGEKCALISYIFISHPGDEPKVPTRNAAWINIRGSIRSEFFFIQCEFGARSWFNALCQRKSIFVRAYIYKIIEREQYFVIRRNFARNLRDAIFLPILSRICFRDFRVIGFLVCSLLSFYLLPYRWFYQVKLQGKKVGHDDRCESDVCLMVF